MQFERFYDAEVLNGMRKQLSLTVPQLAHMSGIPRPVMSMLCCGRLRPSGRQVTMIAEALGVDSDYFYFHALRVHPGWSEIPDWMARLATRPPAEMRVA